MENLLQHGLGYIMIGVSVHPPHGPHSQIISQSSSIFSFIELKKKKLVLHVSGKESVC